jgi:CheY-like chemotaxis protein
VTNNAHPVRDRAAVLIVDDTVANQKAFVSVLESNLYDIVVAGSGQEALALVLKRDFAVILMDIRMPDMDGIETATILRRGRGRLTPILFVSAFENSPGQLERTYLAGGLDYMPTPVDPDLLRRKVRALVDFHLRTIEYAKKSDELVQAMKILQRKVEDLERALAAAKKQHSPGAPSAP